MHQCGYHKCTNQVDSKYKYCYEHKYTRYTDDCPIHGRTFFRLGHCLKCEALKTPSHIITKKKSKYYDRFGKPLPQGHVLEKYYKRLLKTERDYQDPYVSTSLTHQPGIYGIFAKGSKGKVGDCLYIGQSIDIEKRIHQHIENYSIAEEHIAKVRAKHKATDIDHMAHEVELKYYRLADRYALSDLMFCSVLVLDNTNNLSVKEISEALTYCEQAMIDSYHPILNTFAARPTKFKKQTTKGVRTNDINRKDAKKHRKVSRK